MSSWSKPKPIRKTAKRYVICGDGWLWNGLAPWVASSQPDREAGITFRSAEEAKAMIAQLKRLSSCTKRFTVREA
jgi:hypothetical protein